MTHLALDVRRLLCLGRDRVVLLLRDLGLLVPVFNASVTMAVSMYVVYTGVCICGEELAMQK